MEVNIFSFYNNKGGVGKTTLAQNVATLFAQENPTKQVLVIDMCPQANISQFLLGGAHAGYQQNQKIQSQSTRSNIVGFVDWLLKGNSGFTSIKSSYKIQVSQYNPYITKNLFLIAGDGFLESLSLALNYAVINPANTRAWAEFMTAIRRLCELEFNSDEYESLSVFIDCNPSFSIYTQMALVSSDYLVVPMMADFSSLEGIKGIMMLLYGEYPSAALRNYAEGIVTFNSKVKDSGLELPVLFEFAFNSFTANSGIASAYDSVRNELIDFCYSQYVSTPNFFATYSGGALSDKAAWEKVFVSDVKDFHTAGKVSASLGIPLHRLTNQNKYSMPDGEVISLPKSNYAVSLKNIKRLAAKVM